MHEILKRHGLVQARRLRRRPPPGLGELVTPERPNHVWSCDFMQDCTEDGRQFRMLTVIDEFTRRCPAIVVARKLNSDDVHDCVTHLFVAHGAPENVRSDNGPSSSPAMCAPGSAGLA